MCFRTVSKPSFLFDCPTRALDRHHHPSGWASPSRLVWWPVHTGALASRSNCASHSDCALASLSLAYEQATRVASWQTSTVASERAVAFRDRNCAQSSRLFSDSIGIGVLRRRGPCVCHTVCTVCTFVRLLQSAQIFESQFAVARSGCLAGAVWLLATNSPRASPYATPHTHSVGCLKRRACCSMSIQRSQRDFSAIH